MPKSDKELVKLVNNFFSIAREGTAPQRREWLQRYRYWKAKEKIKRPSYKDNVKIPLIFMISDGIQAILTDNPPKVKFLPQEESDIQTADALDQIIGDYYWDKLDLVRVSEEVIWWAMNISGSGLVKYGIDPLTGEFYVKTCNSFGCYPDPSALSLKTLEFFIYASPMQLADIRRLYGERGKEVKAQDELLLPTYDDEEIISPWARESGKSENLIGAYRDQKFKRTYGRALVLECWMRSDETEPIPVDVDEIMDEHELFRHNQIPVVKPEQNHPEHIKAHKEFIASHVDDESVPSDVLDAIVEHIEAHLEEPQETKRLKYPHGRIITIANNILLDDKPAPFGLNYAKLDCILDPRQFWGVTLQEYVQSLQDSRVRRKRQISDNADRMANLREFYNIYSGYDPDKVTNEPAEQVPVKGDPRAAVYQPPVPSLPSYILEDAVDSERLIEKILGYHEVLQGKYPKGSPSGFAIRSLQEALGPRIRKISRHFEWFLKDLIRGIMSMLPYEDPRKIFVIMGQNYKPIYLNLDELNISGEYDIRLVAGSTLPTSRMMKEERAIRLREVGLYDDEAALEYLDDPQKEKILERKSIIQQQQKLIEALMKQVQLLKGMSQGEDYEQGEEINSAQYFGRGEQGYQPEEGGESSGEAGPPGISSITEPFRPEPVG